MPVDPMVTIWRNMTPEEWRLIKIGSERAKLKQKKHKLLDCACNSCKKKLNIIQN